MNKEKIAKLIENAGAAHIVAATKYINAETGRKLFDCGIKDFGENRTDSFLDKYDKLTDLDITWHFIGHLQRNKAEEVINKIDVLHSLDSLKLAKVIQEKREKPLEVFIELKLTDNDAKSGVKVAELPAFVGELNKYDKIRPVGFMAMTDADMTDPEKTVVFQRAAELAREYGYSSLSMGMSDDYSLALAEGATHIRLGRILFDEEDFKDEFKFYFERTAAK